MASGQINLYASGQSPGQQQPETFWGLQARNRAAAEAAVQPSGAQGWRGAAGLHPFRGAPELRPTPPRAP